MLDEQSIATIKLIVRDELAPLNNSVTDLAAVVRLRHEMTQEHSILPRLRKVEGSLAYLTGKIAVVSIIASLAMSTILRVMIK